MPNYIKEEELMMLEGSLLRLSVQNLQNRNQFIIRVGGYVAFQSYDSLIAVYDEQNNRLYIYEKYINYSKTTSKHLYMFLREVGIYNISNLKDLKKALKKEQIYLIK